ncbi:MAG: serine dehydratase [delta proteobacterium ML8_F1]|jgi:L-serine dehydratase|nr:MAG: serine dehydratase [delta proteobacterium ML8_F1]
MYRSAEELVAMARSKHCLISDIVLTKELELYEKDARQTYEELGKIYEVMKHSAYGAIEDPKRYRGKIIGDEARLMEDYSRKEGTYLGPVASHAMAMAFSTSLVNAAMGRICAAPTAGASGILPAALITAEEMFHHEEKEILDALLTASAVGELIASSATLSGAQGGCQAETGTAAAMAAAALVQLRGGSPEACFNAAGIAIKNILGLVCDPIAGLVESPCAKRNASGVMNALASAEMALAGVMSLIPFDEMVLTMKQVGSQLPASLRETSLGGIAITPTAKALEKKIL